MDLGLTDPHPALGTGFQPGLAAASRMDPAGDSVGRYEAAIKALRGGERSAPDNTRLLRAGEHTHRVSTLLTGWAFRCCTFDDGRRQIMSILLPGDTFGIEALFDEHLDYMVWSATPVSYAVIDVEAVMRLFDREAWFRRDLMLTLAREKAASEQWMAQLGRCDAEERTALLLLLLHRRLLARDLATATSFKLELNQQELADMLGLHLIHLNRILSRLRARGFITTKGQDVTFIDREGMAQMVRMPVSGRQQRTL